MAQITEIESLETKIAARLQVLRAENKRQHFSQTCIVKIRILQLVLDVLLAEKNQDILEIQTTINDIFAWLRQQNP